MNHARAEAMTRLVGAFAVVNLVWFVAATVCLLFFLATGWDPNKTARSAQTMWAGGFFFALPALVLSGILYAIGRHLVDERRWASGVRRGIATVHDLRPGDIGSTYPNSATQELTCRLEIRVAGMDPITADYRADIGPLDAARLVDGATIACEISPAIPERVRLWLFADPRAGELTGRYRDFQPVWRRHLWRPPDPRQTYRSTDLVRSTARE
jgi:hypothetical protein